MSDTPRGERLQKLLADAGQGSRRSLDARIESGDVRLNNRRARPGERAEEGDRIALGDRSWEVISDRPRHKTLIYNKPEGELTTRKDPEGRPTVFQKLPRLRGQRWVAVGRLDLNTTGLLVLTTDGELAHAMMHPSGNVDREYAVRVFGEVGDETLQRLRDGVEFEIDGKRQFGQFSDIQPAGGEGQNRWYHVTIMEGRNREVRRLWEAVGCPVSRLKRVRYGAAFLPKGLRVGHWHEIDARDHRVLREDVGLKPVQHGLRLQPLAGGSRTRRR